VVFFEFDDDGVPEVLTAHVDLFTVGRVRNPLHRVDVSAYPDAESQLLALMA
jgi:hypothetical protein